MTIDQRLKCLIYFTMSEIYAKYPIWACNNYLRHVDFVFLFLFLKMRVWETLWDRG